MSNSAASPQPLTSVLSGPLTGAVTVPGDKSISHRALILGALATGETMVTGLLEAEDIMATAQAVRQLGAVVERDGAVWRVFGRGVGGLTQPDEPLDLGNSGTGARLLMGVVAGHDIEAVFTGDESLCRRPMGRVLSPLKQMGLRLRETGRDLLPLTLIGTDMLAPIAYELPVASAQVKSAVLLAGLCAAGETTVIEPERTRDHTEKMLAHFGAEIAAKDGKNGRLITVKGRPTLRGQKVEVPGDPSSAAFAIAAALITPGSDVIVRNVLINPTRTGFYETVREMGADVTYENVRQHGGERIADIRARYSRLSGVRIPEERAPVMIDEYPCLAAVASLAEGVTRMEGLAELRVKESDRLAAMETGLKACGVDATSEGDTLIVRGMPQPPGGGFIATGMDHRIAMTFLVLGLAARDPITVDDVGMIATSFPSFRALMEGLGARFRSAEAAP
ncbi:MAG: 3-phosphoshikimate 1-carboxyvinyltransferase [Hyphomicrobiales bacterium]|nr:3-phosphoshikimate 1-carboxyvinyltransferase [Hyphomicrobiales bacterium]